MTSLCLLQKADLSIYYEAEMYQHDPDWPVRTGVSKEYFIEKLKHHPSIGFSWDGIEFGGALFDGKEAHLAVLPAYQGKWAWLIKPALEWLLSLQETIDVRVARTNPKCIRFCDHNHLPRVSEDEHHVVFRVCNHPGLYFNRRERNRKRREGQLEAVV